MPKKMRFLENRIDPRRKGREPRERWVFEPLDMVLAAAVVAILFWLQWLSTALSS